MTSGRLWKLRTALAPARCWPALAAALLCGPAGDAPAQLSGADTVALHSHSGQFVVCARGSPAGARMPASNLRTNANYIRLEAPLVTVSCERIKQLVWRDLQTASPWQGKIYIVLRPQSDEDPRIDIASARFKDEAQYRVELPRMVERGAYARAITQVVLMELADRTAGNHEPGIPFWLSEGLARRLMAANEQEIILTPVGSGAANLGLPSNFITENRGNPLEAAHNLLRAGQPLTFEQLSWPTAAQLAGEPDPVYRASAQCFVSELLETRDGPARIRAMLSELPRRYNWQFALLSAFQPDFKELLDVEKWWALRVLRFTGREMSQTWTVEDSLAKLDALLRAPVEVRASANQMPTRAEVTLQTIIREWDRERQTAALRATMRDLDLIRLRLAPQVAPLAGEYRSILEAFLSERDQAVFARLWRRKTAPVQVVDKAVRQLDSLDANRVIRRPSPELERQLQAQIPRPAAR